MNAHGHTTCAVVLAAGDLRIGMRLFGVGVLVLGGLIAGPIGKGVRPFLVRRSTWYGDGGAAAAFRMWAGVMSVWIRFLGLLAVVGGVIYVVHPPAHLH